MFLDLSNKKVLVGASTRGIGLAIAQQLAAQGASITLLARDQQKLTKAIATLPRNHNQIHTYCEVDFFDWDNFQANTKALFSAETFDIVVCNTPGPKAAFATELDFSDYTQSFDLIFQTAVLLSNLSVQGMKEKAWGRLIYVSSITVSEPLPHLVLSNCTRSALLSWAKNMATELASNGITVNSILTGYFDTERLNEVIQKQADIKGIDKDILKNNMYQNIPAKRFGKVEEYGYLAGFLASSEASYITGTSIPIDGGLLKNLLG